MTFSSESFACNENCRNSAIKSDMISSISCNVCVTLQGEGNELVFFCTFRQQESLNEGLEKKLDEAESQLTEAREKICQLEAEVRKLEDDAAAQRSSLTSKPVKKTVRSGQQRVSRQESRRK